jgi:Zn-dependent protease with chaperone function
MKRRDDLAQATAIALTVWLLMPHLVLARYEPKPAWNLFSRDKDIELGKQYSAEVSKQLPLLSETDPITRYIQSLGQQLVAVAPEPRYPFSFHVVNQKEINAFALPGGPIYIHLGTIQAADNEAEIVGVMGHEMGHVIMRHSTAAASKELMARFPLAILGGLMGVGPGSQLVQMGINFGVGSYFLKNSRTAESQADMVGTDLMYDAGYDPHQMVAFFEKLEKEDKMGNSSVAQFFSDHPNPGNRAEAVSREVATLAPKPYRANNNQFVSIKHKAAGLKPLTAKQIADMQSQQSPTMGEPRSGDVMPNGSFKTLNHSAFQMTYPANWEIFGDESSAVTIAPRAGMTADAVAYGAIINGFQAEAKGGGVTLDDATHQLLDSLRQSNPDLRVIGLDEDIRLNGQPAKAVNLTGNSPIQGPDGHPLLERDRLITSLRPDGKLFYVIFISPDSASRQLAPTFDKMQNSLRVF